MRFFQALILIPIAILALVISFAEAYDPSPLQDFCVAIDDLNGGTKKNPCFIFFYYFLHSN